MHGKTNHGKEVGSSGPNTSSFSLPLAHPLSFVALPMIMLSNHMKSRDLNSSTFLTLRGGARFSG